MAQLGHVTWFWGPDLNRDRGGLHLSSLQSRETGCLVSAQPAPFSPKSLLSWFSGAGHSSCASCPACSCLSIWRTGAAGAPRHVALCRGQPLPSAGWALGRCLALLVKERPLPRKEERVLCPADVLAANCQPGAAQPTWRGFHALTTQLPQVGVGGEGDPLRFPAPRVPAALFQLQRSALLVGQLAGRWLFWSLGSLGQLFLPVIMPNSFLSALLASRFVLLAPLLPCLHPCPCPSPLPGSGRRPSFRLAAFLSQLPFPSGFRPQSVPAVAALTGFTRLVQNWHVCRWGERALVLALLLSHSSSAPSLLPSLLPDGVGCCPSRACLMPPAPLRI